MKISVNTVLTPTFRRIIPVTLDLPQIQDFLFFEISIETLATAAPPVRLDNSFIYSESIPLYKKKIVFADTQGVAMISNLLILPLGLYGFECSVFNGSTKRSMPSSSTSCLHLPSSSSTVFNLKSCALVEDFLMRQNFIRHRFWNTRPIQMIGMQYENEQCYEMTARLILSQIFYCSCWFFIHHRACIVYRI